MARKGIASRDHQPDKSHRCPISTVKTGNKLTKKKMNKDIGATSNQRMLVLCCLGTKSCLTLCDPMDSSLPGSSVHETFQARMLEWGHYFNFCSMKIVWAWQSSYTDQNDLIKCHYVSFKGSKCFTKFGGIKRNEIHFF